MAIEIDNNDETDFDNYIRNNILHLVDKEFGNIYDHEFISYKIHYGSYSNAHVNIYYYDDMIAYSSSVPNIAMIYDATLITPYYP